MPQKADGVSTSVTLFKIDGASASVNEKLRRQSTSLVTPHYYNLKILKLDDLYQFKQLNFPIYLQ